jgi:hypothetical protein
MGQHKQGRTAKAEEKVARKNKEKRGKKEKTNSNKKSSRLKKQRSARDISSVSSEDTVSFESENKQHEATKQGQRQSQRRTAEKREKQKTKPELPRESSSSKLSPKKAKPHHSNNTDLQTAIASPSRPPHLYCHISSESSTSAASASEETLSFDETHAVLANEHFRKSIRGNSENKKKQSISRIATKSANKSEEHMAIEWHSMRDEEDLLLFNACENLLEDNQEPQIDSTTLVSRSAKKKPKFDHLPVAYELGAIENASVPEEKQQIESENENRNCALLPFLARCNTETQLSMISEGIALALDGPVST